MTGEMSRWDLEPGGEHYEWGRWLRQQAQSLCRRLRWALWVTGEVRPFDEYQGPYIDLSTGTLWTDYDTDRCLNVIVYEFVYEGEIKFLKGTAEEVAADLKVLMADSYKALMHEKYGRKKDGK